MAEAFADRLKKYMKETHQHAGLLAARLDVPEPVIKRIISLNEDPPGYIRERLSKLTGEAWADASGAESLFKPGAVLKAEPPKRFLNQPKMPAVKAVDELFTPNAMTIAKSEPKSVHDLFRTGPAVEAEPETKNFEPESMTAVPQSKTETKSAAETLLQTARPTLKGLKEQDRQEFFTRHLWLGIRMYGSAVQFGKQIHVTSPAISRWIKGFPAQAANLRSIADALGAEDVNALFEEPSEDLIRRAVTAPKLKRANTILPQWLCDIEAQAEAGKLKAPEPVKPVVQPPLPPGEIISDDEEDDADDAQPAGPMPGLIERSPNVLTIPQTPADDPRNSIVPDDDEEEDFVRADADTRAVMSEYVGTKKPVDNAMKQAFRTAFKEAGDRRPQAFSDENQEDRVNALVGWKPIDVFCGSRFNERVQAWMRDNNMTLGQLADRMKIERRPQPLTRLRNLVCGFVRPDKHEIGFFFYQLKEKAGKLRVETSMPSAEVMKSKYFEEVCREMGFGPVDLKGIGKPEPDDDMMQLTVAGDDGKTIRLCDSAETLASVLKADIPSEPEPALLPAHVTEESATPEPAPVAVPVASPAPAAESKPVVGTEVTTQEGTGTRGILGLRFGSGDLDFAVDGGKSFLYTVTTREFMPVFAPGTTLVIRTEGFCPDIEVTPAVLLASGWYLIRLGEATVLRRVTAASPNSFRVDAGVGTLQLAVPSLNIVGRAAAAVRTELL